MSPTSPARWMTMSGRASRYTRSTFSTCVKSYSCRRGTKIPAGAFVSSFATTRRPKNPEPPVTRTRLFVQKLMMRDGARFIGSRGFYFEIRVHHHPHELFKSDSRFPANFLFGFCRVTEEQVYFSLPIVTFVDFHMSVPVQIEIAESFIQKISNGVCLAGRERYY